jgi:hypothetical protein
MNKDNVIEFKSKEKYTTNPDRYKKFFHRHDIDTTELSAQNVLWDNSRIDPIMCNRANSGYYEGTYTIKNSQLVPYKSLIRKIFDWFMAKGI